MSSERPAGSHCCQVSGAHAVRTGFILLCGLAAAVSTSAGGALWAWYSDPFRGTPLPDATCAADRLLGLTIRLPARDREGRRIPPSQSLLLAPAPCSICADPARWIESLAAVDAVPVVALFSTRDPGVQNALDARARRVFQVERAGSGRLAALLSDAAPLFAVTDAAGRIRAVSGPFESAEAFCRRVGLR